MEYSLSNPPGLGLWQAFSWFQTFKALPRFLIVIQLFAIVSVIAIVVFVFVVLLFCCVIVIVGIRFWECTKSLGSDQSKAGHLS